MKHRLTLKHIEVFRAVISNGSASAAARVFGISQPAVSKIVAQAEFLTGFPLFERRQGRLIPTETALKLYRETNVLFASLESINSIVDRVKCDQSAPISFGSVPLLSTTLLPQVLPGWLKATSNSLNLHTHDGAVLLDLVAARQIELALLVSKPHMEGVESRVLARSPLFCAMPSIHRLAAQDVVHASDLENEAFIGLSHNEGLQASIERVLLSENARVQKVMQVPLMAAAVEMVEVGVGVTLVDAFGMHIKGTQNTVYRRFLPSIYFEYHAVWPMESEPRFHRGDLIKFLSREAGMLIENAANRTALSR